MSALLPRLSGAQDIARDTSRQVALSQFQTAIISYKNLKRQRPSMVGTSTDFLNKLTSSAIMTDLPQDPAMMTYSGKADNDQVSDNKNGFLYFVIKKNGATSGAIVLATRVESDAKANYVSTKPNYIELSGDFNQIFTCTTVTKEGNNNPTTTYGKTANSECTVPTTGTEYLRYILKF